MKRREREAARLRNARNRVLNDELTDLRAIALERTRSIDAKASFVVAGGGVVLAALITVGPINAPVWLWTLSTASLVAAIVAATISLWPRRVESTDADRVLTDWQEHDDGTGDDVIEYMVERKRLDVKARNGFNETRRSALVVGYVGLLVGVGALLLAHLWWIVPLLVCECLR